ncbi:MAG: hypothetical protein R2698_08455 [Microthrixaceae bacterium]
MRSWRRLVLTSALLVALCVGWLASSAFGGGSAPTTTSTPEPRGASFSAPAATATAATLPGRLQTESVQGDSEDDPNPALARGATSQAGAATVGDIALLVGGLDPLRASIPNIARVDLRTGRSTVVGRLPRAMHDTAVTTLRGRALVMGGAFRNRIYGATYAVDGRGRVFEQGRLPHARAGAGAASAADGSFAVLAGGRQRNGPSIDVLRTVDGRTFETIGRLLHPVEHPGVVVADGAVWVVGGEVDGIPQAFVQRVDLSSGTTVEGAPLPQALSAASVFVAGGSVFVAGGRTTSGRSNEILHLDTRTAPPPVVETAPGAAPTTDAVVTPVPTVGVASFAGRLPTTRSDAAVVVSGDTATMIGGLVTYTRPQPKVHAGTTAAPKLYDQATATSVRITVT